MRVLIATDASSHAERAVALAAAQAWPDGTAFRVVAVDDGRLASQGVLAGTPVIVDTGESGADDLAVLAARSAQAFDRPGWAATAEVLRGRPSSVVVEEADRFRADVIVVGSRGRGRLEALALGSVSAEVIDHANRPVLVARGEGRIRRVVLADDGSDHAAKGRRAVAEWPIFEGAEVTITGVAHVSGPIHSAIAPTMYRAAMADLERSLDEARQARDQTLRAAAMELQFVGRRTAADPREGDPASQIIAAGKETRADLIVVGSRGQGGLARLLLGSVARNVLYEAPCSVLVVR